MLGSKSLLPPHAITKPADDLVIQFRKQHRCQVTKKRDGRQDVPMLELSLQLTSSDVTSWVCASQDTAPSLRKELPTVTHK